MNLNRVPEDPMFRRGYSAEGTVVPPIKATLESTEESRDAIALRFMAAMLAAGWNGLNAADPAKGRRGVAVEAYAQADAFIAVRDGGQP